MDNVTHALAGLLLGEATLSLAERTRAAPSAGFRRAALVLGVVTAELPDADLLYSGPALGVGQLGYLLHHRGHTHTLLFAVAGALVAWAAALALRRARAAPAERGALLALALAGTLSHVALDFTNSYGVHPFWPVDDRWVYGDAVFIVEPWLWVAALPPLLLLARGRATRALLALALAAIVAAAWVVEMVDPGVALALTIAATAWLGAMWVASRPRRLAGALAAWALVEAVFFAASGVARRAVREAVGRDAPGAALADAALTPAPGNPLCFRALTVELEGDVYRVASAAVAPVPALRTADGCGSREPPLSTPSARRGEARVRWTGEWSAPRAELATLAEANCVVAAALRFHRVPAWQRTAEGGVRLVDLRFGDRGFATVDAPAHPTACPRHVPPWTPPRADVLRDGGP